MVVSVLYFDAIDGKSDSQLWYYYDGKFYEPTAGDLVAEGGLYPQYLDAYGNNLLFEGQNAAGDEELWITGGTPATTHQIAGIKDTYLGGGLDPSLITTYKSFALFDGLTGYAGAPVDALWVMGGSGAKTYQVGGHANKGVKGANTTDGLMAYAHGFTLYKGLEFFDGYDAAGNIGLWRTDGTIAGTFELQPITGAIEVGTPGSDIQPDYTCVVGTMMFFAGEDLEDSAYSLWVTNGTAAGTVEIGGEGNKGIKGSPYQNAMNLTVGMGPTDITAFDGKAMFAATDNTIGDNGYYTDTVGLWTSNGTAAGTVELGGQGSQGIKDAQTKLEGGLEGGVSDPDFTVYKSEVLFLGVDDKSHPGQLELWETNGTVAGTTEIGGIGNAGITGAAGRPIFAESESVSSPPDFTVYDGEVFFTAMSSLNNEWGIWETNGTAAGTHLVTYTGSYIPTADFTIGKA